MNELLPDNPGRKILGAITPFAAILTILVGALGVMGRLYGITVLNNVSSDLKPFTVFAAAGFVLLGIAMLFRRRPPVNFFFQWILPGVVLLAGVVVLTEFVLEKLAILNLNVELRLNPELSTFWGAGPAVAGKKPQGS